MHRNPRRFVGRLFLACVAGALAAGVGLATPAWANVLWSSEQTMVEFNYLRYTFIYDVGAGNLISYDQFASPDVRSFYERHGFDQNFMYWAPITSIDRPDEYWTSCRDNGGGLCADGNVVPGNQPIVNEIGSGQIHVKTWNGAFIGAACGNWNHGGAGPIPRIAGTVYRDANDNGLRDPGEPGLPGWSIELRYNGAEVAQTTSGPDGFYAFSLDANQLPIGAGTYSLTETPQQGWTQTQAPDPVPVHLGAADASVGGKDFGNAYTNHPPVADAGPAQQTDQTTATGASVTLDGTRSSDPDSDPLTYTWTGPFGTATGATPTVTMPPGTSTITLQVSDGQLSATATTTVTVFPPITATGTTLHGVEGTPLAGTVATFADPDPASGLDDYTATIDWGDGTPTSIGTITGPTGGPFSVAGAHTYADEGTYQISVRIVDIDNTFNTTATTTSAGITDAPLSATGNPSLLSTNPLNHATLATFTDENPLGSATDFTTAIDWGDGTATGTGDISGNAGGTFTVTGSHTYAQLGPYTITIVITDKGGATTRAVTHALLYGYSNGGTFAIGDDNAVQGATVRFWGAQWANNNTLSAGPAPDAFKGFIDGLNMPGGPTSWTTDPGNSSQPPATIPTYMAVVVPDHIVQDGSTITGDTVHIVIVKTDSGYTNDPGHAGTGTVVAILH